MNLVEKYQAINNRKNIILRPTEDAIELYKSNSLRLQSDVFGGFFEKLSVISDKDLNVVIDAVQTLNDALDPPHVSEEPQLVRKK